MTADIVTRLRGAAGDHYAQNVILMRQAADEIERLNAQVVREWMRVMEDIDRANGWFPVRDNQAVHDGVVYDLEQSLDDADYYLLLTAEETP